MRPTSTCQSRGASCSYSGSIGKYFYERCLIFGTISSVGIYDRFARLIVIITVGLLCYPRYLILQHLDDVCMIGSNKMVNEFYETYNEICSDVGISLQEPCDAAEDKAFGPTISMLCGIMPPEFYGDHVPRQIEIFSSMNDL